MSVRFVLRAGERGYSYLPAVGLNASYVAGHPDGAITRHSSFNFHEYQSGIPGLGVMKVFGDELFTPNGTGYNMHPHHNFIIMAFVLVGALTHINTIGKIDELHGQRLLRLAVRAAASSSRRADLQALMSGAAWPPWRRLPWRSRDRSHGRSRITCLVATSRRNSPIGQTFKVSRLLLTATDACLSPLEGERLCLRAGRRRRDRRCDPDTTRQHCAGGRGQGGNQGPHRRH
jgi:hypothetical protein